MASFGKNMKIQVPISERERTRRLFTEVLGAKLSSPRPDLDLYLLDDGFNLGAFYVDPSAALASTDHEKAPWLEFLVDDPAATAALLAKLDITPFEYVDREHLYFRPPAGPVFRLAKR